MGETAGTRFIKQLPEDVVFILKTLEDKGYESYVVGGACRDFFMDIAPKDYDITTSALPDEVEVLFDRTVSVAKQYGTITINIGDNQYEVTTMREDIACDGRRPQSVKYTKDIRKDLARRDFTINAIAIGLSGDIVDPYGGLIDINYEFLDTVGTSIDRLAEDSLRCLRAIRFASKYNMEISSQLELALRKTDISNLSVERIQKEFNSILLSKTPSKGIRLLERYGFLKDIVPELYDMMGFDQKNPHHDKTVYEHTLVVLDFVKPTLELRLSALFHDIGKPSTFSLDEKGIGHFYGHAKVSQDMVEDIMRRLKYDKKTIETVKLLVYYHMSRHGNYGRKGATKIINKVGEDRVQDLFALMIADSEGCKPPHDFDDIYRLKFMCEEIINTKLPVRISDLEINGNDLKNIGFKDAEIGFELNKLLSSVISDSGIKNSRKELLTMAVTDYNIMKAVKK